MVVAGNDGRGERVVGGRACVCVWGGGGVRTLTLSRSVAFYEDTGSLVRTFDYSSDTSIREFSAASFSPSGDACVLGNYDRFLVYTRASRGGGWEEAGMKTVENMYSVSALAWKPDGSRVAVGALCGVVDMYDACLKRARYRGKFEFTYVSSSQVCGVRARAHTRARTHTRTHARSAGHREAAERGHAHRAALALRVRD